VSIVKTPLRILRATLAVWLLNVVVAFGQAIPVTQNLWRLVVQEDTDGDRKITIHDRTTPFEIRDANGSTLRVNFPSCFRNSSARMTNEQTASGWTSSGSTNLPWTARTGSSGNITGTR